MRKISVLFAVLMVGVFAAPVVAQTQDGETPISGAQAQTRIEADSESHEIRFYVDGELAAVLKGDGFHVLENISYGGSLTDYGAEGFKTFGEQGTGEGGDVAE